MNDDNIQATVEKLLKRARALQKKIRTGASTAETSETLLYTYLIPSLILHRDMKMFNYYIQQKQEGRGNEQLNSQIKNINMEIKKLTGYYEPKKTADKEYLDGLKDTYQNQLEAYKVKVKKEKQKAKLEAREAKRQAREKVEKERKEREAERKATLALARKSEENRKRNIPTQLKRGSKKNKTDDEGADDEGAAEVLKLLYGPETLLYDPTTPTHAGYHQETDRVLGLLLIPEVTHGHYASSSSHGHSHSSHSHY